MPGYWNALALTVSALTLFIVVRQARRLPDLPTQFLVMSVWLRFVLAAFPATTNPPLVAGFSINALSSIAITSIGILLIDKRLFLLRLAIPLYGFIVVVLLTSVFNRNFSGVPEFIVRYAYFIVIALHLYRSISIFQQSRVLLIILLTTLTPIILQWISFVVGYGKSLEEASGISFIGGYHHESAFSLILLLGICFACLIRWQRRAIVLPIIIVCVAGIIIANYRTTVLAAIPVILISIYFLLAPVFSRALRPILLIAAVLGGLGLATFGTSILPERFNDFRRLADQGAVFLKPPETLAQHEKEIMSGRVGIWSRYLHSWLQATPIQKLIGLGVGEGEQRFSKHAHNAYLNWLHDFGIIGLIIIVSLKIFYIIRAFSLSNRSKAFALTSCFLAVAIQGFATNPLFPIEGLLLYAALVACLWHEASMGRVIPSPTAGDSRGIPMTVVA